MKKLAMILVILAIAGIQVVVGSNYEPCAPYNQSRNLSDVKKILQKDGVYYENLRAAYAQVYNSLTGRNIPATKSGMETMLQRTVLIEKSFVKPEQFENGVKVGNNIEFTDLVGAESDYWLAAIDNNGKILDVFGKVGCINPQRKRKSNDGKKLTEAIVIDTIRTKIVNKITTYDSICHIEYRSEQEPRPREIVYVSVRDNYSPYYSYGPCYPIYYNPLFYCGGRSFLNIVHNTYVNNSSYRNDYHTNDYHQSQLSNSCGPTPGYGGANTAGEVRNNGNYRNGNGYQGSSRGTNVRVSSISDQNAQSFRTRQSGNQNLKSANTVNQGIQSNFGNQNVRTSQSRQSDNQSGQFNYGRPSQSSQTSPSRQNGGQVRNSNYGNQNLKSANQSNSTNYSNQTRSSNYNSGQVRSSGYNGGQQRSASVYNGGSQSHPSSGGYSGGHRR